MGSLTGGSTNTSTSGNTSSSSSPWAPQATQVTNLLSQAGTNLQQQQANGPYSGQQVAGQNAYQAQANGNAQIGSNDIINNSNVLSSEGQGLLGSSAGSVDNNDNQIYSNSRLAMNPGLVGQLDGYATGGGGGLSSALNSAALTGAQSIQGAQSQLQQNAALGTTNQTGTLAADAGAYMNSAPIQSAINSTNADINSTLAEQTAPGLDRAAAAGGSLNSSRAGAAQAQAAGQAALAQGTADASIQNNAYNQGLGTALSSYESGLNSSNAAATASGSLGNSAALGTAGLQTGAANTGLSQALSYNNSGESNALAANNQLLGASSLGANLLNNGSGGYGTAYGLEGAAGSSQYATDQAGLTNALDEYNTANNYGSNILGQYQGLIQGNYGSNTTGTSSGTNAGTSQSSILSQVGGIASLIGAFT